MTDEVMAKRVWTTPSLETLEMKETRNGTNEGTESGDFVEVNRS